MRPGTIYFTHPNGKRYVRSVTYALDGVHSDSSMEKSIQHNKERFKLSEQLVNILENSRKEMGWK